MRAVIQRVLSANCIIKGKTTAAISKGLLIFLGIGRDDTESDIEYIVDKVINLRIFEDEYGKMNLSVQQVGGSVLLISQFTLYGDVRKGRRPSFDMAMEPEKAFQIYNRLVEKIRSYSINVETGRFRETMQVSLINDGPVTILLDSRRLF